MHHGGHGSEQYLVVDLASLSLIFQVSWSAHLPETVLVLSEMRKARVSLLYSLSSVETKRHKFFVLLR